MQSYRNLEVRKLSHQLTLRIYRDSVSFPQNEVYGLTSQVRRGASSIGANIAEGCGRGTDGELRQSLRYAMGSATELDNHLLLLHDLGMIDRTRENPGTNSEEPIARSRDVPT